MPQLVIRLAVNGQNFASYHRWLGTRWRLPATAGKRAVLGRKNSASLRKALVPPRKTLALASALVSP